MVVRMFIPKTQRGQSLMEIMLAIAVATIGILTIGYLLFDGRASYEQQQSLLAARLRAQEGVAVVGALLAEDFDSVAAGTYGIASEPGIIAVVPGSDTGGLYTRTLTVVEIEDGEKEVTATITWQGVGDISRSTSVGTRFTDWRQHRGSAEWLTISPVATRAASSTRIEGLIIENDGPSSATLAALTLDWEGAAVPVRVVIGGTEVWLAASSSETIRSGNQIDVLDVVLPQGVSTSINEITFNDALAHGDMLLTLMSDDGSARTMRFELQ